MIHSRRSSRTGSTIAELTRMQADFLCSESLLSEGERHSRIRFLDGTPDDCMLSRCENWYFSVLLWNTRYYCRRQITTPKRLFRRIKVLQKRQKSSITGRLQLLRTDRGNAAHNRIVASGSTVKEVLDYRTYCETMAGLLLNLLLGYC